MTAYQICHLEFCESGKMAVVKFRVIMLAADNLRLVSGKIATKVHSGRSSAG
jgi:hypothetical protein